MPGTSSPAAASRRNSDTGELLQLRLRERVIPAFRCIFQGVPGFAQRLRDHDARRLTQARQRCGNLLSTQRDPADDSGRAAKLRGQHLPQPGQPRPRGSTGDPEPGLDGRIGAPPGLSRLGHDLIEQRHQIAGVPGRSGRDGGQVLPHRGDELGGVQAGVIVPDGSGAEHFRQGCAIFGGGVHDQQLVPGPPGQAATLTHAVPDDLGPQERGEPGPHGAALMLAHILRVVLPEDVGLLQPLQDVLHGIGGLLVGDSVLAHHAQNEVVVIPGQLVHAGRNEVLPIRCSRWHQSTARAHRNPPTTESCVPTAQMLPHHEKRLAVLSFAAYLTG